ncbi:MAG: HupE/UreJ family protein [Cypionkella sp.]
MQGKICLQMVVVLALLAQPALAHTGEDVGGFMAGIRHPISGLDHVAAMVAVGLWGGILGKPALWLLPITFPLVMCVGATLGIAGVPFPAVETGIALSGIVLGAMVLFALRPPLWLAMAMVGIFAMFHGYAHGAELPSSASPVGYAAGFVLATSTLHLIGIAIGQLWQWRSGKVVVRAVGAAIALAGGAFLTGLA